MQKVAEAINSGKGTVGRLIYDESLYNEARAAVAQLDEVIANLQAGQGTAGKLLKDPALYDEARASIEQRWLEDLRQYNGLYDPTTEGRLRANKESRIFALRLINLVLEGRHLVARLQAHHVHFAGAQAQRPPGAGPPLGHEEPERRPAAPQAPAGRTGRRCRACPGRRGGAPRPPRR